MTAALTKIVLLAAVFLLGSLSKVTAFQILRSSDSAGGGGGAAPGDGRLFSTVSSTIYERFLGNTPILSKRMAYDMVEAEDYAARRYNPMEDLIVNRALNLEGL